MYGFSYRGTHSSTFGCYFIPSALELGRDMPAYIIEDLEIDGRDGGYYIGNHVKPREFSLECFIEAITYETREGQLRWLDRNTCGKLVFDERPHVYYDVRPSKRIEIKQYTHGGPGEKKYSGTFTVSFRAYEPFGKLFRNAHAGDMRPLEKIETGMLHEGVLPSPPMLSDKRFLLYNCGTEKAHTVIRLAGDVGDGLTIENQTTGQKCEIKGLRAGDIPTGAYLEINSATGQVWLVKGEEKELTFYYHDLGYLQLAPCTPFVREVKIAHTAGSKEIVSEGLFLPHMAGQFLLIGGAWHQIHRIQDENTAHTTQNIAVTGSTSTPVVTMNEMVLAGTGTDLTRFEIAHCARIR